MKNKKQYKFGESNYRKMNPEIQNKTWFHLEKGENNSLNLFVVHPDDVKSCFELKRLKEQVGTKGKLTNVCTLTYIGQPRVNSIKEFFEMERKTASNIDDFFEVTMYGDTEYLGKPLLENTRLFTLVC